jgi:hypothetical protein
VTTTVELRTKLSVTEVVVALNAMAHDWCESTLPVTLRRLGISRVSVTVNGTSFSLQSCWGRRIPYRPKLVGVVVPENGNRGSVIRVTTKPTLAMRVSLAMWLATDFVVSCLVRYRVTPPEMRPFSWEPAFAFFVLGIVLGYAAYAISRRFGRSERLGLLALLESAVHAGSLPSGHQAGDR